MSIVTLADVHAHLNIPAADQSHDTELQGFIDAAQPVVENVVGVVVTATAFTESYDGGLSAIVLRYRPVQTVTSLKEYRGNTEYALTQVATPNAATSFSFTLDIDTGRIVRRSSGGIEVPFPAGKGTVIASYTAGRAVIPGNIRLGCLELIRHWYQQTQQGGRRSFNGEAVEDASPDYPMFFAVPNRVMELLMPHKRAPSIG